MSTQITLEISDPVEGREDIIVLSFRDSSSDVRFPISLREALRMAIAITNSVLDRLPVTDAGDIEEQG